MPATIVLVHDDMDFLQKMTEGLKALGQTIESFHNSMDAIGALEAAGSARLLITRIQFKPGTPSGISLARIAKYNRPGIKVLFVAKEQYREHAHDLGEFLPMPASVSDVVTVAERLVGA